MKNMGYRHIDHIIEDFWARNRKSYEINILLLQLRFMQDQGDDVNNGRHLKAFIAPAIKRFIAKQQDLAVNKDEHKIIINEIADRIVKRVLEADADDIADAANQENNPNGHNVGFFPPPQQVAHIFQAPRQELRPNIRK